MSARIKIATAVAATACFAAGAGPAAAAPTEASAKGSVSAARQWLASEVSKTPEFKNTLDKFDRAPESQKREFAEALNDPKKFEDSLQITFDAPVKISAKSSTSIVNGAVISYPEHSYKWRAGLSIAGLPLSSFYMYEYWNTKPHVLDCRASWSGVGLTVDYDPSGSRWDDTNYAHCQAYFDVSVARIGAHVHKKMHTWGDRVGTIRGEFVTS